MAAPKFFKTEFGRLARYGVIEDPLGELAFGYLHIASKVAPICHARSCMCMKLL
jgi:hypothetical protein